MKTANTLYGLSAGNINLSTGKTKYFNVFENNRPTDTLVLFKNDEKYTVVSGAGQGYDGFIQGNYIEMQSQGRIVKRARGIGQFSCTYEGLSQIKNIVKANKCSFWVFK